MPFTLVIDASNLRDGGGVSHLRNLLDAADFESSSFERAILYGVSSTLAKLDERKWLVKVPVDFIDSTPVHRAYWQFVKLPALLRQMNAGVLFSPGGMIPPGCPCPCVTMSRNMLPFDSAERARFGFSWMRLKMRILRALQSWSFGHATGVIYLTEHARRTVGGQLRHRAPFSTVIPHGIEDRFRRAPREQRPLSTYSEAKPFRLLYVSILSPYKHQWHVAAAVETLRREGLPIAIDFVGPREEPGYGKLRPFLKADGSYITHRDGVSYREIEAVYHHADAFVYASTCENLPNILLEAMAAGLPIASSNREPMTSILGDCGVYFDAENPVSIAAALTSLVTDASMRQALAAGAYKKALDMRWERCAKETLAFIAQTVQSSGGRVNCAFSVASS